MNTTTNTKEKIKYVLKSYLTLHTDEKHNENPDADGHFEQLLYVDYLDDPSGVQTHLMSIK